ncbi:SGNH/GDSL hydrolase family protein [Nonomuraea sp. K274]|uniref:SGNH/GDSL hydrolase family protein n=2 Tax=Nonomuraea cypriaca TaxID=1187855 RepID=A0A931F5B9_9ACTN|nr:SGNH/GDSL hydrolase family protein [Nonomuraea cypriaca]
MALLSSCVLVSGALVGGVSAPSPAMAARAAYGPSGPPGQASWVSTWATGVTAVPDKAPDYPDGRITYLEDQTVRQVVHTSVGGDALTLRLSNEHGDEPLRLGAVHVAARAGTTGTDIAPATDRRVTFGGKRAVTLPAGARVVSDPVKLDVAPDADLVISLHLPERTEVSTVHQYALQVNAVADGDVTGARTVTPVAAPEQWMFLSGVNVAARPRTSAVVVLGDSISDGVETTIGANHRWPDLLSDRLRADRRTPDLGVANVGIAGNRLLHDPNPPAGKPAEAYAAYSGPSALRRFRGDVLDQPGTEHVIVLLGVNDLGQPGLSAPVEEAVTAEQLIQGHLRLIARAHARGLKIYGGTVTPFKGPGFGFWNEKIEAKRQAVNRWIRTSGAYDAVIDFDAAVRDPAQPLRLRPDYDSGDHLHLNDAGAQAMATAVPLRLLR